LAQLHPLVHRRRSWRRGQTLTRVWQSVIAISTPPRLRAPTKRWWPGYPHPRAVPTHAEELRAGEVGYFAGCGPTAGNVAMP